MSLPRLTAAHPLFCRSPAVVAWARSLPAIRPQQSIAASVENQRLRRPIESCCRATTWPTTISRKPKGASKLRFVVSH